MFSVGRTHYTPTHRNLYLCKSYKRVLSLGAYSLSRISLVHALSTGRVPATSLHVEIEILFAILSLSHALSVARTFRANAVKTKAVIPALRASKSPGSPTVVVSR